MRSLSCLVLVLYMLCIPSHFVFAQRKNLLLESTAEEVNAIALWDVRGSCCPYSIQKSSAARRFGKYSFRFEINKSDSVVANGKRAEINRFATGSYPMERWLGLSIFVPNSTDFITDQKYLSDVVTQWHDVGSPGESELKCPFDLSIDGTRWVINVRHAPGINSTNADIKEITTDIGALKKGVWTDFVIHLKFTHLSTGLLQIWMNGAQVHNYNGPMGYNHAVAPFFKAGLYKWPWNKENLACCGATNSTKRVIYIDEIRIGNENAAYKDVEPTQTTVLKGTVSLEGRSTSPGNHLKVPLQVELYTCPKPALFAKYNVTTDKYGQFSVAGIPVGAYSVAIKNPQALKKVNPVQAFTPGITAINFGELQTGDVNNDNIVDSSDLIILSTGNNKILGSSGFDSRADLNGDSLISKTDETLLLNNFQETGQAVSCNCVLKNPTITTSSCNAATAALKLSAANGTGPYNLAINGQWYNNVNINDPVGSFSFPEYSLWPSPVVPMLPSNNDSVSIEVGVKFVSSKPGFVKGVRFYNGNDNSGYYTGRLYNYKTGSLEGSATFTNVTKNGWQTVLFPTPVFIEANTTYIASCFSSAGNYAANNNYYFADSGRSNGPLTALMSGTDGSNGVYQYEGGMPTHSHRSSNYWVDVKFSPDSDTLMLTNFTNADGCENAGDLQQIVIKSTNCLQNRSNSADTSSSSQNTILQKNSSLKASEYNAKPLSTKTVNLEQNYPNPARNETFIKFSLPKASKINLSVFDMNGRLIKVLMNGTKEPGAHIVNFNVGYLSSGLYYYKLSAGDFSVVKKMTIQ